MKKNTRARLDDHDNASAGAKIAADFAVKIPSAWQRSVDNGIHAGRLWVEAKNTLSEEGLARLKSITTFNDAHISGLIGMAEESITAPPKDEAIPRVRSIAEFATRILGASRRLVDGRVDAGRLLTEAKKTLSHEEWTELRAKIELSDVRISELVHIAEVGTSIRWGAQ
jgi:hypothetical protein